MKNLILTFVFALVTMVTFSQTLDFKINENEFEIQLNENVDTIYVTASDTLLFTHLDIDTTYTSIRKSSGANLQSMSFTENLDLSIEDTMYLFIVDVTGDNIYKTIILVGNKTTGINDIEAENIELNVYPNPVQDFATVTFTSTQALPVELYSLSGQLILTETNTMVGTNNVQLNMSDLPQGMYLVKVGSTTFRTIKK